MTASRTWYTYAAPILQAHGMTATFFVLPAFTGETAATRQDNSSWKTAGRPTATHLIWPEIEDLYNQGFEIGSHTMDHRDLNSLYASPDGENKVIQELVNSRQAIDDHLGSGVTQFLAYPYGEGAYNAAVEDLVKQNGYQAAVAFGPNDEAFDPGLAGLDLFALPRPAVYSSHTLVLNPEDSWYFFMHRLDPEWPRPALYERPDHFTARKVNSSTPEAIFLPGESVVLSVEVANWRNED